MSVANDLIRIASKDQSALEKDNALRVYFSHLSPSFHYNVKALKQWIIGDTADRYLLLTHKHKNKYKAVFPLYIKLLKLAMRYKYLTLEDINTCFGLRNENNVNFLLQTFILDQVARQDNQINGFSFYNLKILLEEGFITRTTYLDCVVGVDDTPFILFSDENVKVVEFYGHVLCQARHYRAIAISDIYTFFGQNLLVRLLDQADSPEGFFSALKSLNWLVSKKGIQEEDYTQIFFGSSRPTNRLLNYFLLSRPSLNEWSFSLMLGSLQEQCKRGAFPVEAYCELWKAKDENGVSFIRKFIDVEKDCMVMWFLRALDTNRFPLSPEALYDLLCINAGTGVVEPIYRDASRPNADKINQKLDEIYEKYQLTLRFILEMSDEKFTQFKSASSQFTSIEERKESRFLKFFSSSPTNVGEDLDDLPTDSVDNCVSYS